MEEPFKQERIDRIRHLTLRELTHQKEGGETALLERLSIEVDGTDWTEEQKAKVKHVANLVVTKYHAGDTRDDNTYSTHILRVACRILSSTHFNIRDNPDLIIAALLHDTVEDRPERLLDEPELSLEDTSATNLTAREEQRKRALNYITHLHGENVADMVSAVSNPIYDKSLVRDREVRQALYRTHVRRVLASDSPAKFIKLSDFIDNCLGLEFNKKGSTARNKLAHKYQPLLPDMLEFVMSSEIHDAMKTKIIDELFYADELCNLVKGSNGIQRKLGYGVLKQATYDSQAFFWRREASSRSKAKPRDNSNNAAREGILISH
jgi:hypothetical protein